MSRMVGTTHGLDAHRLKDRRRGIVPETDQAGHRTLHERSDRSRR